MDYVFMMDSDSDLPYDLKEKYNIPVVYMPYALDGKEYFDDLGQTLDHKSYYDRMRNGAVPVTSALNEETYMEYFEPVLNSYRNNTKQIPVCSFNHSIIRTGISARENKTVKQKGNGYEDFGYGRCGIYRKPYLC